MAFKDRIVFLVHETFVCTSLPLFHHAHGAKQNLERSTIVVPPKQIVKIDYPYYKGFVVKLWNKAKFEVGVSAREYDTDSLRKGFGLSR